MKVQDLSDAMYGWLPLSRYAALTPEANVAMRLGGITTLRRAAMFLAQIGEESGSLRYQEELSKGYGSAYYPYYGRTFIQITWDYNYKAFGAWCHAKGLVTDPDVFYKNPALLADDKWAWYGPVWFWTTHGLNAFADANDIKGATLRINGGYNGLADRTQRWQHCLALGSRILPDAPVVVDPMEEIMAYYKDRAHFEAAMSALMAKEVQRYFTVYKGKAHGIQSFFEHYMKNVPFYNDATGSTAAPGINVPAMLNKLVAEVTAIKEKLGVK